MDTETLLPGRRIKRNKPAAPRILRTRLVTRISLVIGIVGTSLALLFAAAGSTFIRDFEYSRQLAQLGDLLASVESTARIACFTGDKTLATEVARGVATNPAVAAVRIIAGDAVLAQIAKPASDNTEPSLVRRSVSSPFDDRMVVGEIIVTADGSFIHSQASAYSRYFILALMLEAIAVTIMVALIMVRIVVKPITQLAERLRRFEIQGIEHLPLPDGHEENEIGRLARAFNRMIDGMSDLLARKEAMSEEIAHSERRFRTLAENSPDIIARFDLDGTLVFANPAFLREIGEAPEGEENEGAVSIWRPAMPFEQFKARMKLAIATGRPDCVYWEWETHGGPVCHEIHMVAEYDKDGAPVGVLAIGRNISERRQVERQLRHQATHDALTGLPNRFLLKDRLERAVAQARREDRAVAVIFIDLDNFKDVNDRFGHDAGDELLVLLATRMRDALRESDTVARLGGDEFIIMLENAGTGHDLDAVVQKLFESISRPCELSGHRVYPSASFGIAVHPRDGDDGDTLMRNADTAMYAAKEMGRNGYRFYSADMNDELTEWLELSAGLHQAIENREFELYYQPKARLDTGEFVGMEALLRWRHPVRGMVPPSLFVPIAEKNGLIGAIGDWVLNEACRQARAWLDVGLHPGRIAVNLSAAQCSGSRLTDQVRAVLAAHGLQGRHLEVEITESIVMNDAEESIRSFWNLRDIGVEVSVDDFGTGYSSLSYLKRLPVNNLKIDKSFVDDIDSDPNDAEIIRAIIAMAHSLKLGVIAEGVETAAQIECLRAAGCDLFQGYFYSRPLPPAAIAELLRRGEHFVLPEPAQQRQ
jgi:diguanylate cyclase (GGDEF)-like protein/PAS domain S-box-containing protein